jgi:hypothetical protein
MGVVVAFDYAAWQAMFPEFASVSEPAANSYFAMATGQHNNTIAGPVCDPIQQALLLNFVTAFFAAQFSQPLGSPNPGGPQGSNSLVGRISSATEGSISVASENMYPPGSAQFWQQNKYGAYYWNATKAYRTMRYRANPTVVVNGIYPSRGWGGGGWGGGYGF